MDKIENIETLLKIQEEFRDKYLKDIEESSKRYRILCLLLRKKVLGEEVEFRIEKENIGLNRIIEANNSFLEEIDDEEIKKIWFDSLECMSLGSGILQELVIRKFENNRKILDIGKTADLNKDKVEFQKLKIKLMRMKGREKMSNVILDFFGMFDKVDDIIYEPIKMVCDALRQPLKQMDAKNERKKMELNSQLDKEMQQMGLDLEVQRKRENAEIDKMIADSKLERDEETLAVIEEYQKNMGSVAVEIGKAIGEMSIDLQAKAQDMVIEKSKRFRKEQVETLNEATQGIKEIRNMYPNEDEFVAEIIRPYTEMMTNVVKETNAFILDMKESMKKLTDNINTITEQVIKNTDEYLKPIFGNKLESLANEQSKSIDSHTTGYIENK